jgi:3-oxoacyl-[acyl-carrier protein] reductase
MVGIDLKSKVAIITGGSRGIGRATTLRFAQAGADVVINYHADSKSAQELVREVEKLDVRAVAIQADVGVKADVDRMVAETIEQFGQIDILVNNAGIWEENPIDKMTEESLRRTIDINLMGCFYTSMAVAPHMKKRRSGSIVYISSTAGQRGEALHSPYAASKGALISLTKSLAPELVSENIRVNCVAPGWAETDMTIPTLSSSEAKDVLAKIPMGRVATPEEMANAVLFIASDLASFITGEILNVNGGAVLCG